MVPALSKAMPPVGRKTQYKLAYESAQRVMRHIKRLALLESSSRANMESAVRCYERQCKELKTPAWPIHLDNFGSYITWYCLKGSSAHSIACIKSHLKRHCHEQRIPWLSPEDEFDLQDLEKSLLKRNAVHPKRKLGVGFDVLGALYAAADKANPAHLQLLTMSTLAHDCLLRGGELVQLTVGDVR